MNKKISISIVPLIIAIIIAVAVGVVLLIKSTQDENSKLSKVYSKMIENQTYSFTRYDLEEKNKKIVYRKANKALIDKYDLEGHTSTLIAGGDTYLISHADKEYYVYLNNNSDENRLTNTLENIINLQYTTGKEKIYGKTYKYEEYNGVSDFMISSENNIDMSNIKTRFYFKGNELVYLKTIYDIIDEETGERTQEQELQTVIVSCEVEDSIFEIPSDYAEN